MTQQSDKTELQKLLEALPDATKIKAGGRLFEKYGDKYLQTDSGVLPISDFTKYFSDFVLIDVDNK